MEKEEQESRTPMSGTTQQNSASTSIEWSREKEMEKELDQTPSNLQTFHTATTTTRNDAENLPTEKAAEMEAERPALKERKTVGFPDHDTLSDAAEEEPNTNTKDQEPTTNEIKPQDLKLCEEVSIHDINGWNEISEEENCPQDQVFYDA